MIYENMIIYWKMFDNQEFHRQCSMSLIEMWWLRDDVVKRSYDCLIADIQGKSIFHETPRNIWNFFTPTIFTIWCPAMQFRFRCLKIYLFSNWAYSGLCASQCVGVLPAVLSALNCPGSLFGWFWSFSWKPGGSMIACAVSGGRSWMRVWLTWSVSSKYRSYQLVLMNC